MLKQAMTTAAMAALALAGAGCGLGAGAERSGRGAWVIRVVDGDTLLVRLGGGGAT